MLQIVLTYVKLLILLSKYFFEFANFELINDLHHLNVGSQSPIHCLKLKFCFQMNSRAREYVEDSLPSMDEDPILLAKGWEGDIDNVDTSKLQALIDGSKQRNAINNNAMLWYLAYCFPSLKL